MKRIALFIILVLVFGSAVFAQEAEPTEEITSPVYEGECPRILLRHSGIQYVYVGDDEYLCHYYKTGPGAGEETGRSVLKSVVLPTKGAAWDGILIVSRPSQMFEGDILEYLTPDGVRSSISTGTFLVASEDGLVGYLDTLNNPALYRIFDIVTNEEIFSSPDVGEAYDAFQEILGVDMFEASGTFEPPANGWVFIDPVSGQSRRVVGDSLVQGKDGQVFFTNGDLLLFDAGGGAKILGNPDVMVKGWIPLQRPVLEEEE